MPADRIGSKGSLKNSKGRAEYGKGPRTGADAPSAMGTSVVRSWGRLGSGSIPFDVAVAVAHQDARRVGDRSPRCAILAPPLEAHHGTGRFPGCCGQHG